MAYNYKRYGVYKSSFEDKLAKYLKKKRKAFKYESDSFSWLEQLNNARCLTCESKSVGVYRKYTPDFFVGGFIIEAKGGKFNKADRHKILKVLECNPGLRDNFVICFNTDNKLTRRSKKRYSDWCLENNIKYCIGIDGLKYFIG